MAGPRKERKEESCAPEYFPSLILRGTWGVKYQFQSTVQMGKQNSEKLHGENMGPDPVCLQLGPIDHLAEGLRKSPQTLW